jgi:hypothetical protein
MLFCMCLQRLHLQVNQVEHQQSLATSEAALAPLNPFQRSQVRAAQPLQAIKGPMLRRVMWQSCFYEQGR